jgi:hypothetical protein
MIIVAVGEDDIPEFCWVNVGFFERRKKPGIVPEDCGVDQKPAVSAREKVAG